MALSLSLPTCLLLGFFFIRRSLGAFCHILLPQVRQLLSSAHYLENSGVRLNGLHFWGSPFSAKHKRRSSNGAFQYKEEFQRTRLWRYVPNDVDVLLTHGSANDVPLLAATIERTAPYVHAHGHDHELHGATLEWPPEEEQQQAQQGQQGQGPGQQHDGQRPQLITVNAAICNKHYEPLQLPIVVDLPSRPSPKPPPVSVSYVSSVGNGGGAAAQKARVAAVAAPGGSSQPHEPEEQPQKRRQQPQQRRQQQQQWRKQQQQQRAQGDDPQAGGARGRGSGKVAVKATSSAKAAATAAKSLHTSSKATVKAAAKATVKAAAKAGGKVAAKAAADVESVATKAEFQPWWRQRKERRKSSKQAGRAALDQAETEAA